MNKNFLVHFAIFAAVAALTLTVLHLALLCNLNKWAYVGTAIGIEALSISLLVVLWKRGPQLWLAVLNALATGIAIAGLYVHLGVTLPVWQSALIFGAAVCLYFIFGAINSIPAAARHPNISVLTFLILTASAIVVCGIVTRDFAFALSAFVWLYLASYSISLIFPSKGGPLLRYPVYASFAAAALAIFAVLVVVSEGDALDAITPTGSLSRKKKK